MNKKSVAEIIIENLQELTEHLEAGKPLTDKFTVTTIEKVNCWEAVVTKEVPKKPNHSLTPQLIEITVTLG